MTPIVSAATLAEFANLVGDPARAGILGALMDGRALTAGELAGIAHVGASTASEHLAKLAAGGIVSVEKQGRHRYYRLARPEIAQAIEAMMAATIDGPRRHRPPGPRDEAMRIARSCYDHIAGRLGVGIADALVRRNVIHIGDDAAAVTDTGQAFFCDFGIDLVEKGSSRRPLCRTCLDWSERRPHLAGRLGAAILSRAIDLGWLTRQPRSRTLGITSAGRDGFSRLFHLEIG